MQNTSKSFRLNLLHEGSFMHYTGEFYANHLRRDLGLALLVGSHSRAQTWQFTSQLMQQFKRNDSFVKPPHVYIVDGSLHVQHYTDDTSINQSHE